MSLPQLALKEFEVKVHERIIQELLVTAGERKGVW